MPTTEWLTSLGVDLVARSGSALDVHSPIDGAPIASVNMDTQSSVVAAIAGAADAFELWRTVPAPRRGELIRRLGEVLRAHKEDLAHLVTLECGKIIEEGRGEVQEMIDICDFAVGLSRQLYGLTIASERNQHTMHENWLPLGTVGVISAFNFPVAVWSWNFALAIVCGDPVVWKPSEKTPLTALACQALFELACRELDDVPDGLSAVVIGAADIGQQLTDDPRIELVSATGSTRMGGAVGPRVAQRFGKCLLELGGNNAVIVTPNADLEVAIPAIVFGAVGTAGQRCTTTRRVIAHESVIDDLADRLKSAYTSISADRIGDPRVAKTLIGPLIDRAAFDGMQAALAGAQDDGGQLLIGGARVREDLGTDAWYVEPAIVRVEQQIDVVCTETFAPILYVLPYRTLEEALDLHNAVRQGLSSAIFTTDLREAEYFRNRSDCGIANVNIGTSGAEIGGAFGGEKETGGGRESGSDAWKAYMRRQTSTTYWGTTSRTWHRESSLTEGPARTRFLVCRSALLAVACGSTGGITVEDEQRAGAETSQRVEEQVGLYTGEYLATYVDTIGRRLVAHLGDTPYYFKFRVIDQAMPNAFAAPGGYVYVSRGMLALINSEDELAGILAHEISHVTLRHHARQSQASVLPGVLTAPGRAVGAIVGEDVGNIINAPISAAGEAYLSSYGRGQESEADDAAMLLTAQAGYDPAALGTALETLERTLTLLTGQKRSFSFFDSHPTTPDRIGDIETAAASLNWRPTKPVARNRASVYKRLDGLTWGPNNPLQGIFQGQQFMQPDMNLSITFPDGWRTINTPRYIGAFAPDEQAIILFGDPGRPGRAGDLATEFAEEVSKAAGLEPQLPAETKIGNWPAWVVKIDDASGTEPVSVYYVWIEARPSVFKIVALGPQRYYDPMRETAESVRRLTEDELKSIVAERIRIVTAENGESIADLNARSGNVLSDELTAAINGLPDGHVFAGGNPVKILRVERYFGD